MENGCAGPIEPPGQGGCEAAAGSGLRDFPVLPQGAALAVQFLEIQGFPSQIVLHISTYSKVCWAVSKCVEGGVQVVLAWFDGLGTLKHLLPPTRRHPLVPPGMQAGAGPKLWC